MKIYTKTGDKGMTSLIGGKRVPKNSARLESYGTIDELNSFLGMIRSFPLEQVIAEELVEIQSRLFDVGGNLATDPEAYWCDGRRYCITGKWHRRDGCRSSSDEILRVAGW